jgi:ankyrin repeat protein
VNVLQFAIWAAVGSLLFWSSEAVASVDDCVVKTATQRASWVAFLERRLHKHDPVRTALIAAGASANGTEDSVPLVAAAGSGATSLAELLIRHGASVDKVDWSGHTALEDAVREHHLDTVRLLLSHGSDPNRMVGGHATILDLVAHSSGPTDQAIARELRAYGAGAALTRAQ